MVICKTASILCEYVSMYFDIVGDQYGLHPRMVRTFAQVVSDSVAEIIAAETAEPKFAPETIEQDKAEEIVLGLWTALTEQCSSGVREILADDLCSFIPDTEAEFRCDWPLDIPDADQVRIAKHGLIRIMFDLLQQRNVIPKDRSLVFCMD